MERVVAGRGVGGEVGGIEAGRLAAVENLEEIGDVLFGDGFVERDAEALGVNGAEVDAARFGEFENVGGGSSTGPDADGIEEVGGGQLRKRMALGIARQDAGEEMDALGDAFEAVGAVIDGIERGHVGEERLGGADVARGLVAANVLLAGLKGEAQGGTASGIPGDADDASGHLAFEGVACGQIGRMRAAVAERHAEPLGAADGDVRAEFARGPEEREAEEPRRQR